MVQNMILDLDSDYLVVVEEDRDRGCCWELRCSCLQVNILPEPNSDFGKEGLLRKG